MVGNDDDGAVFHELVEGFHHQRFRRRIEPGGGFVQEHEGSIPKQGASEVNPFGLLARELDSPGSENGLIAFGQGFDELVSVALPGGLNDFLPRGFTPGLADGNVGGNGGAEGDDL
jgi:hypothetical protein